MTREQFSPCDAQALKNELCMKGVAQDVAEEVVDEEKDEVRALRADCKKALSLIRNSHARPCYLSHAPGFVLNNGGGSTTGSSRAPYLPCGKS